MEPRKKQPVTTGGAGYVPPAIELPNFADKGEIRKRLYDNINPYSYTDPMRRVFDAVILNTSNETADERPYIPEVDDLWATYLLIPKRQRHLTSKMHGSLTRVTDVIPAAYKPTKGNITFPQYRLALAKPSQKSIVDEAFGNTSDIGLDVSLNPYNNKIGIIETKKPPLRVGENRVTISDDPVLNRALREFTVGRGRDNRGEYASYYDLWDLSPYRISNRDQSFGIGNPFEIYDRIYFDDYYNIPKQFRGGNYIPEVIIEPRKK